MDTPQNPMPKVAPKPAVAIPAKQAAAPQIKTVPIPKQKPAGWFSFSEKGMRASVVNLVNASTDIPAHWKNAIAGDIATYDAKYNFFTVDCHRHVQGGKGSVHYTVNAIAAAIG